MADGTPPEQTVEPPVVDESKDGREQTGRILVVDDNRINRLTCSRGVERQGHEVITAEDGRQALELLRREHVDAVLLDIVMPEMDGYEVLAAVKQDPDLRDIPVIVVSAVEELDSVVRCIEMGAEDYLTKPFNPVLLRARLQASLRKKRVRDLERAYLQQEMRLRQSEKLATLGRLSAGMAHELNNPSAAARRGADQLTQSLKELMEVAVELAVLARSDEDHQALRRLTEAAARRRSGPSDPLTRSEAEDALAAALEALGSEQGWQYGPILADAGFGAQEATELISPLRPELRTPGIRWLVRLTEVYDLLAEIGEGTARISELVGALKNYSYMDRAPIQEVDVQEGLENTLIILRNRLKEGVQLRQEYADDLPRITAYGGELNQVWTNLIDNAVDAMDGEGTLTLRTRAAGDGVEVEIEDTGPGIPAELLPHIFEPFFTTKEPGQGTGLGLNITHNIVVERHGGEIDVSSEPGRTCFTVRLPAAGPAAAAHEEDTEAAAEE